MTIMIDTFEPESIELLVAQTTSISRSGLNNQGIADYMWFAVDNHRIQVERKQSGELLANLDAVEEQLSREMQNGIEETILLIEGVCEPVAGLKMATQVWHKTAKNKNIMTPVRTFNCSYTGYKAWQSQLDKAGVTIIETFDYVATALALVALYQNSQKEEHKTLRRYVKERINIKSKNPHIRTLMGISGGGVGEEIATALIERYGTVYYIMIQEPEELAETLVGDKRLGIIRARKLLIAIGRSL